ncbi:MAG TPA: hypothetical protein DEH22_10225, partial [Chloroflexi bacterium]|nr:hypothetical protein [Chloroflexota bacterium]
MELTFNQAMDAASVENNFTLLDVNGSPIPGAFGWGADFTTLVFTPTQWLARSSTYTLILVGGAQSQGGAPLGNDLSQRFYTVPHFYTEGSDPEQGGMLSNYQGLSIYLSSPPDLKNSDPLDYISITPKVPNLGVWGEDTLYINGSFAPNTEYVLTLSGAFTDLWGEALG